MYQEAQSGYKPADMYYNRGTVYLFWRWIKFQVQNYLEDYEDSLQSYKRANEIDATVDVKNNINTILERVKHIDNTIANKVKLDC